jgi:hypothetical protein
MKRYLLGLIAVVIAVGSVAFTTKKAKFAPQWFVYVGSTTLEFGGGATQKAAAKLETNYMPLTGETCLENQEYRVCAIFANPDPNTSNPVRPLIDNVASQDIDAKIDSYFQTISPSVDASFISELEHP